MNTLRMAAANLAGWPKALGYTLAGTMLALAFAASLMFGAVPLSLAEVWQGIQQVDSAPGFLIHESRLPRSVLAVLVGAQFAASGMLLQQVLRNPLADPAVTGVSSGAMLAVMLWLLFDVFNQADPSALVVQSGASLTLVAQLGGTLGVVFAWLLAQRRGRASTETLLISGIVVSLLLSALAMGLLAGWGSSRVEVILTWLSGSLYGRDWSHVAALWPWSLGLLALPLLVRPLTVLALGDERAHSLGLPVSRWRAVLLLYAASLAASAVSIVGPLAFIGLLVPQALRQLGGQHLASAWPAVLYGGALLTLLADTVGRAILPPADIPVGAVTALIGAPVFLFLLTQGRASPARGE